MQLKDCIALLSVYSASALRRYIPKAEFGGCTVAQTIHNDLRGIYRALGSYTKEDTTKGSQYVSLSRITTWISRLTTTIQRLTSAGFQHGHESCEVCRDVLTTGFHVRHLALAVEIVDEEQQKVHAEILPPLTMSGYLR